MAESVAASSSAQSQLNLTAEEKRVFKQLFAAADTEKLGVVTGEVAVKFFEKTRLEPRVLGEIWQIADTDNRGLLTPPGFSIVLRLIGHYQYGKEPSPELAYVPGPLPKFEGLTIPGIPAASIPPAAALQAQSSGGPIRVPPLTPENATEYQLAFERLGARNGVLEGEQARQAFEQFKLPNESLGRIWNLADTDSRGSLNSTEFVIAMHLLACHKNGTLKQLPTTLPPGLYEAAVRRPPQQPIMARGIPGGRVNEVPPVPGIPKQFSGQGQQASSPLSRSAYTPQGTGPVGGDWAIHPAEKAQFDQIFSSIDKMNRGYITGDEAVPFFGNSRLPEEILAQIWDLADINSEGHLNRDEFAVAIHLIRQQRALKENQRGKLPSTLPANLIPPSMRQQIRPPQQPTAPTFDNATYATSKPSEDLFGLDAFSTPTPSQQNTSTGSSAGYGRAVDTDMFGNKKAPISPVTSAGTPQSSSSMFKPFVPSSNFGQNMLTANLTGDSSSSGPSQSRGTYGQKSSVMEDLLGDNDPEVSSRLTNETTDLANLSNQVGTLNKQLQEVKSKRVSTDKDISQMNQQKRDFEIRLSQLRSHYEQEVKDVKTLDSRLADSRAEVRRLQQDCSQLEATLQDLQGQHRQVVGALESDQMDNANLKDRIKSANGDISQLRAQLEKLKMESRQQKGLVSINKKQLSTTEGERDRVRNEIGDFSRGAESSRSQVQSPSDVVSPALSTANQSTNPFFRKTPTASADSTMSPSPFATAAQPPAAPQNQPHSFDNMFGPSYGSQTGGAPPSFRSDSQPSQIPGMSAPSGQSVRSSEGPDVPTPVSSPPASSYHESPRSAEPPPPPESRQITSSFLPLRSDMQRNDSFSSSVKVAAPASRYGDKDFSGTDTPTNKASTTTETERDLPRSEGKQSEASRSLTSTSLEGTLKSSSPSGESRRPVVQDRDGYSGFGGPMPRESIPGAFPGEPTSPLQTHPTGESTLSDRSKGSSRPSEGFQPSRTDPFTTSREPTRASSGTRDDFDAAFAGFGPPKAGSDRQHSATSADGSIGAGSTGASRFNQEFPPIKENFDPDSDDSNSEHGFDDNFTTASPHQKHSSLSQPPGQGSRPSTGAKPESTDAFGQRPPFGSISAASSQLPTPGAQKSPPTYEQAMPETQGPRDPNQFAPEFGNLLPSRQDPTSPSTGGEKSFGAPSGGQTLFGGSTASKGPSSSAPTAFSNSPPLSNTPLSTAPSDAYQSAVSHPSVGKGPSPATAMANRSAQSGSFDDDFDREFNDLTEAKESDDKVDDDFAITSHHREGVDEFNPVFDSPAVSKSSTMASDRTATGTATHAEDHFNDFEHNIGGPTQVSPKPKSAAQSQQPAHDWDALFGGLDSNKGSSSAGPPVSTVKGLPAGISPAASVPLSRAVGDAGPSSSGKAPLSRTISTGESDDPKLKQLTGIGYSREDSLEALEKYDYQVDKAADYLVRNAAN